MPAAALSAPRRLIPMQTAQQLNRERRPLLVSARIAPSFRRKNRLIARNEMQRGSSPGVGGRDILVEFDSHNVPPMIEQPFYRAQLDGWIPLIAHPERNAVFQSRPGLLATLVRLGAKVQVTAGSLTGDFGDEARAAAVDFLHRDLVHIIATDAHNLKRRPPRVRAPREAVTEIVGADVTQALFVDNPRTVIDGTTLVYDPDLPYTSTAEAGFLGRLRRLFKK